MSWPPELLLTLADVQEMSEEQRNKTKWQCQTNLAFLTNCVLRSPKKKSLVERVHGQLIEQFVKKDPTVAIEDLSPIKERIILAFRGALKSTIGMADLTQWVLCYPNIRILILSGELGLAQSILKGARQPFVSNAVIRELFPEWAVSSKETKIDEFICPKRDASSVERDPTFKVSTFDSVKAGGHFELLYLDDCTNEINSSNSEQVEKTKQNYDDIDPLLEPGGYIILQATRWALDDLPEYVKFKGEENETASGVKEFSYFSLPVWTLRRGDTTEEDRRIAEREKMGALLAEDVVLAWPEKLTARFLWPKYRKNRNKFQKQYLLNPEQIESVSFSSDLLLRHTIPYQALPRPHDRFIVINWDLAGIYSGRRALSQSDYSCGIAAMFELSSQKLFVYDAILARFNNSTEMSNTIVDFYQRQWRNIGNVGAHRIEDTAGARNLEGEIRMIAQKTNIPFSIDWTDPENKADAKNSRILMLAGGMQNDSVWLISNLPYLDEIKSQFERWSINAKRRRDDAPDCIAQIYQQFRGQIAPNSIAMMTPSNQPPIMPEPIEQEELPNAIGDSVCDNSFLDRFTVPHTGA